jgi:hypothetical protein
MLSLFCQTDQPSIAPCRRSLSRNGMASIRSSVRSRWTSSRPSSGAGSPVPGLSASSTPRQHPRFEEAEQGIGVGGGGRLVLLQFVTVVGQRVLSV